MAKPFVIPTIYSAVDKMSTVYNKMQAKMNVFAGAAVAAGHRTARVFSSIKDSADGVFNKIVNLRNAIVVTFAGGAVKTIYDMVAGVAAFGDELSTTARKLGITTQGLQELQFAAKLQNVEDELLNKSIEKLNKNMGDLHHKQGSLYASLVKTNPALLKQLKGVKDTGKAFDIAMKAIDGQKTAMDKAALAQQFFGKSGQSMIQLLQDGFGGFEKLKKQARDYGIVLSDETIAAASKFDDANDIMNVSLKGLKYTIASQLMPVVMNYLQIGAKWIQNNRELINAKISEWASKFASTLGWVSDNWGKIILGVKIFIGWLLVLKAVSLVMATLNAGVAIYNGLIKAAAALQVIWNIAMAANPMVLIVTAIILALAALIAIIAMVISKVEGWGEQWDNVVSYMKTRFEVFKLALSLYFQLLQLGFMTMVNAIVMAWKWGMNKLGILSDEQYRKDIARIKTEQKARVDGIKSTVMELAKATKTASETKLEWKLKWKDSPKNAGKTGMMASMQQQMASFTGSMGADMQESAPSVPELNPKKLQNELLVQHLVDNRQTKDRLELVIENKTGNEIRTKGSPGAPVPALSPTIASWRQH